MIKSLLAFLVLTPLSRLAGLVGVVGKLAPVHLVYRKLFDFLIGVEDAREWREDHVELIAEYVDDEIEIDQSSEELAANVVEGRQRTETYFSDGDTILALAIAGASFFASPLVAVGLAVLLVISVSVRLTAINVLAYTEPDPEAEPERLFAEAAWNGGVLGSKNLTGTLTSFRFMADLNYRLYERWLHEVFLPTFYESDWTTTEKAKVMLDICIEELWHTKDEEDGDEEDEEASAKEDTEEADENVLKTK